MGGITTSNTGFVVGTSSGKANTGDIIGTVISTITTFFSSGGAKTIRDNAKRKKAQEIANNGGYNTLTDYQKMLIGYANPTLYGKVDPAKLAGVSYTFLLLIGAIIIFIVLGIQHDLN